MKTTIYLWVSGDGWKGFEYGTEETSTALKERGITIGDGASIGYGASIGDRARIGDGASIGNRASIGDGASIVKTIFITGTRHTLTYYSDIIHIGCKKMTVKEWLENFESVGKAEDYSPKEIKEYGEYIALCNTINLK